MNQYDPFNPNSPAEYKRKWVKSEKGVMKTFSVKELHIAQAFVKVAEVNHYMIGFTGAVTLDELEKARQILIVWENSAAEKENPELKDEEDFHKLQTALNLIEQEIKGAKI